MHEQVRLRTDIKMKFQCMLFGLIVVAVGFDAIDAKVHGKERVNDETGIKVSIDGKLVIGPGAFLDKAAFVVFEKRYADGRVATLKWPLEFPGSAKLHQAVADLSDVSVTISGNLVVFPDEEKDKGPYNSRYKLNVTELKLRDTKQTLLANPGGGRWMIVTVDNGLTIFDRERNRDYGVFDSVEQRPESAIDMQANGKVCADGKYFYARQGLVDKFFSLPDLKTIAFKADPESTELITLGYRGFSPDGKYVVMDGYRRPKIPDTIVVFEAATGKEVSRIEFDQGRFNRQYHFAKRNKALVVIEDKQITLLYLDTGASFTSPIE